MPTRSTSTRLVVTGGAGFIGSHVCDALVRRGHHVVCVDNLVGTAASPRNVLQLLDHPRFELVTDDILEWAQRAPLAGVEGVFHLAASKNSVCMEDPERDLAVNALATLRLVRAAARDGVRKFVHASTGSVMGEARDALAAPVSYYGASKLAGEAYCRVVAGLTGLDHTILRYYHVIGPRQDGSDVGGVVPIFVGRALRGLPLTLDGDGLQTRSFTSVFDVVRANLLAFDHPGARAATLSCASGISVTIAELAAFVLAETGCPAGVRHGPARPGDVRRFDIDNGALRDLGLEFDTDWRAIVRTVVRSLAEPRAA